MWIDWNSKEKDLIDEYESIKPMLSRWGSFIDDQITSFSENAALADIKVQLYPKYRIKENYSLVRKAFYRDFEESSAPLRAIEDKVGTRIVLTTLEDVKMFTDYVKENDTYWSCRESRGLDKKYKNPREFDYQSVHLNLEPKEKFDDFFKGKSRKIRKLYQCELQIRTLLQHAFAEVGHDTIYKGTFGYENKIVRTLSRSMAFIEVADEHFCRALEIMKEPDTKPRTFLKSLIDFSNKKLDIDIEYKEQEVDPVFTGEIYEKFQDQVDNIEEIEKVIIQNKKDIEGGIKSLKSYLKNQPIVVFIFYLIIANSILLRERWHLDSAILEDLCYRIGYSTRK